MGGTIEWTNEGRSTHNVTADDGAFASSDLAPGDAFEEAFAAYQGARHGVLMANGTVTMEVGKAVREAKAGKLEYRTDRGANVHVPIGKKSFDERALLENYATLVEEIVRAKPSAAKGRYIRQITLTTTMGPGIHVDSPRTRDIADEFGAAAGATEETATVSA